MFTHSKCIPCQGGIPPLRGSEVQSFLRLLNKDWSVIEEKKLVRDFQFDNYQLAIIFTNTVAELAEKEGHHHYIHINFKTVKIILFTHKIEGLHENDFLLASKIDNL
jgi:4a-hydroxytetrahydrobiopterin dehydratase